VLWLPEVHGSRVGTQKRNSPLDDDPGQFHWVEQAAYGDGDLVESAEESKVRRVLGSVRRYLRTTEYQRHTRQSAGSATR
jgi:hypothetical protein